MSKCYCVCIINKGFIKMKVNYAMLSSYNYYLLSSTILLLRFKYKINLIYFNLSLRFFSIMVSFRIFNLIKTS